MQETIFKTGTNILISEYSQILSPNDLVILKGMNMKQVHVQKISAKKEEVIIQIDEFNTLFEQQ